MTVVDSGLLTNPLAVVAIGVRHPALKNYADFRQFAQSSSPALATDSLSFYGEKSDWNGHQFSTLNVDYKKFGVPPIYRKSIASETWLVLQAVEDALQSVNTSEWNPQATDVFCGTCFGFDVSYNNEAKMAMTRQAVARWLAEHPEADEENQAYHLADIKEQIALYFGANSHDRVGEMASTIPARVASWLSLHGKCQTIESLDGTGFQLLQLAADTLASPDSDTVILTSVQRFNSRLVPQMLAGKQLDATDSQPVSEGAVCLVVRRLSDAVRDDDNVLAVIDQMECQHHGAGAVMAWPVETSDKWADSMSLNDSDVSSTVDGRFNAASGRINDDHLQQLGFGLANQSLLTIGLSIAQMDDSKEAGSGQSAVIQGNSLNGISWQVSVKRSGELTSEQLSDGLNQRLHREPIAVVGYSPIVGPCPDKEQLWSLLSEQQSGIDVLPVESFNKPVFWQPGTASRLSSYSVNGSIIGGAEQGVEQVEQWLDELPFRFMPVRRNAMDIAQKAALIAAYQAVSGVNRSDNNAVILGSNLSLRLERDLLSTERLNQGIADSACPSQSYQKKPLFNPGPYALDGMVASGSGWIISALNELNAQSYCVEAACASSLAAIHNSVRALQSGRVDMVLTGGLEFPVNERDFVLCSAQMMLSQDKISPFSEWADGFTPGDGGALFVLKRLSDAERAGDNIVGVIHGISGSCDARSMTAPDVDGQSIAINKAQELASVNLAHIDYIEAHGTGTLLGDAAETESLKQTYGEHDRDVPLVIGSVKSNLGHCFAGAGSVGLAKVLLAIENNQIPPTILRGPLNEKLPLADIPAVINTEMSAWQHGEKLAAVSSFGTGGINYHVILGGYVPQ